MYSPFSIAVPSNLNAGELEPAKFVNMGVDAVLWMEWTDQEPGLMDILLSAIELIYLPQC